MNEIILSFGERVKERPFSISWEYPAEWGGGTARIAEDGIIDYDGLEDKYKMLLYVYSINLSDKCPFKRRIMKYFNWTAYKVGKLFKELKKEGLIESCATFSENTGLLSGRGYVMDWDVMQKIKNQNDTERVIESKSYQYC